MSAGACGLNPPRPRRAVFTPYPHTARMLAEPPMAALFIEVLQTRSLPPSPAPTATGWRDSCRAGFAPAEEWRLGTAHGKDGLNASGVVR